MTIATVDLESGQPALVPSPQPTLPARVNSWLPIGLLGPMGIGLTMTAVVVLARGDLITTADGIRLGLTTGFVGAGLALISNQATRRLGELTLVGVTVAGLEFVATAYLRLHPDAAGAQAVEGLSAGLMVAIAFHALMSLPDGRLSSPAARGMVVGAHVMCVAVGLLRWSQQPDPSPVGLAVVAGLLGAVGITASHHRYAVVHGADRKRMQWLGLALALCSELAVIVVGLRVLIDWPGRPGETIWASLALVAAALAAGSMERLMHRVDRLLSHAISAVGLSAVATFIYLVIVIGLGRVPTNHERSVLLVSMVAAALSPFVHLPARQGLTEAANRLVHGEERDPAEALDTFCNRLTRALPMEELLLQLVELCRKHLSLTSAEVWTGVGNRFERAASVPDRGPAGLHLGEEELSVITGVRMAGRDWAEVWLPSLLAGHGNGPQRIVPMSHLGKLYGLLVLERADSDDDFDEDEERVLTELARPVGLALHNSELDGALQATLAEVERKNMELQTSRSRIVAAADQERLRIERNLHDGAQQHLVALAIQLRLIQRLAESDPTRALEMVDEARTNVLATVEEVRALAHGIYPPLLMDKGLPEALAAAARRAALPTIVEADGIGRYPQDVEAAVYFCCLEALQNAAKHAGDDASVLVVLEAVDDELRFNVSDNGAGFELSTTTNHGHGFMNLADRIGAIGGSIEICSAPGQGTRIFGRLPAVPLPAEGRVAEGFGPPSSDAGRPIDG